MSSQEIPSPEARKAWQKIEKEWRKALDWEAGGAWPQATEAFNKVATSVADWFALTGADRKIKDDDDDAEDFNECLQNYHAGNISACITGCTSLLQTADYLGYWVRARLRCLQTVASVKALPPSDHCYVHFAQVMKNNMWLLRCAHVGEADASRMADDELKVLEEQMPCPPWSEEFLASVRAGQAFPPMMGGLPIPSPKAAAKPAAKPAPGPAQAKAAAAAAPRGELCPLCHQRVFEKMKAHKKKCPQREVQCKLCKTRCTAESVDEHMRDECEHRQVKCEKCEKPMRFTDLTNHKDYECELEKVKCKNDGCRWQGFRRSAAEHEGQCLYLKVTCMHCLHEVLQKEMPGHQCDPVDMGAPCSVCLESFSSLTRKGLPPVMMLINGRRTCAHVQCQKCADSWSLRNAHQGLASCPICRAEYDSTTALPEYLLRPEVLRPPRRGAASAAEIRQRPPLPRQEEMKPGKEFFFVSPLDVRFTHDSISECFAPYMKDGIYLTDKEQLKILTSAKELLDGDQEPKALEMLDVVWYKNNLYVAGTFNRRLCMYRLLALFATDRFGLIKVQVKSQDEIRHKLSKSLTTKCEGKTVAIRSPSCPDFGVGQSLQELNWPEAVAVLGGDDWQHCPSTPSETEEESRPPTPAASSRPVSDIDRVIAATAEFYGMALDQVRTVLKPLNEEQRWLTCKRFRHNPEFGGGCPPIKLLEKFVQSCLDNGFRERHSNDRDPDGCFEKILKASGVESPPIGDELRPGREYHPPVVAGKGTLKNFFAEKGIGFIAPDDGTEDVLIHFLSVINGGEADMVPGTKLSYELEINERNGKSKAIRAKIESLGDPNSSGDELRSGREDHHPVIAGKGTLKRFIAEKGIGFIAADDGTEDVFIHVQDVINGGEADMVPGTKLSYDLEINERNKNIKNKLNKAVRAKIESPGSSTAPAGYNLEGNPGNTPRFRSKSRGVDEARFSFPRPPPPKSRAAALARSLSPRRAAAEKHRLREGESPEGERIPVGATAGVSFKAPPASFRERSTQRSSVKAPPARPRDAPLLKAPPVVPPPPPREERQEARQDLLEVQRRLEAEVAKERMEKKALEEKNALLEEENTNLLGQLSRERQDHRSEVQQLQNRLDSVLQQLKEFQESRTGEVQRDVTGTRRSRWGQGKKIDDTAAEDPTVAASESGGGQDPWQMGQDPWQRDAAEDAAVESESGPDPSNEDPWWNGQDPWRRDSAEDAAGVDSESGPDAWQSYVGSSNAEDIEHFARHWRLDVGKVHQILTGLSPDEVIMVLRRFDAGNLGGESAEMLLQRYVESCQRNGFKKNHPTDSGFKKSQPTELAPFASSWGMPCDKVKALLGTLNSEQQTQVITGFRFDKSDYSDAMNALRSYVGYLSDHDFNPPEKWEAFAKKWSIPSQDVAALFRRLEEKQVDVVVKRFMYNSYSKHGSVTAQLKSYVSSCVSYGFRVEH